MRASQRMRASVCMHVAAGAGEPGRRGIDVVRAHEEGEVAVAHEVGDPLAHLVVEDAVVLLDVLVDARVARLEEALAPDLVARGWECWLW